MRSLPAAHEGSASLPLVRAQLRHRQGERRHGVGCHSLVSDSRSSVRERIRSQTVTDYIRSVLSAWYACRRCGKAVGPFDERCPSCGIDKP